MMPERADALSSASPVARALYEELLRAVAPFGPFEIEVKKSSIHLVRSSAFAGVHLRKQYLLITIKAAASIPSGRIIRTEQVSTNRWDLDVKVSIAGDFDAELTGWLREAYEIC
jgi:hypothetical protein